MIKVFKLNKEATLPTRTHKNDAGIDLYATENSFIPVGETKVVKTGVAIEIPEGFVGKIEGRSSMNSKGIITSGGVIDAGYTGDISVILNNFSATPERDPILFQAGYRVKRGEKIAQLLLYKVETPEVVETDTLWTSDRGAKGFGSSGK